MKKRGRLRYIMGIDWTWIYQRPQVFASMLARDWDVEVVYPRSILTLFRARQQVYVPGIRFRILWTLPLQEQWAWLRRLVLLWHKWLLGDWKDFSAVWVGYPLYGRYIPNHYSGLLVYDCMDLHKELYPRPQGVGRLLVEEKRLVERCDVVMASSHFLQNYLKRTYQRYGVSLVRNGYDSRELWRYGQGKQGKKKYSIAYVGTISSWFDWDVLRVAEEKVPEVEFVLFGPVDKKESMPILTNSSWRGVIPREELGDAVSDCDAFIMPFQVNALVEAVDPVKLYEYIAWGKCIICSYYPELDRFKEFVYFYRDRGAFVDLIANLCGEGFAPKFSQSQQREFLEKNTWEQRYLQCRKLINSKYNGKDAVG